MDSATVTTLQQLILNEALKQNPNNPSSNGYGFALAVVLFMGFICVVGIIAMYRRDTKRQERQDIAAEQQRKEEVIAREKLEATRASEWKEEVAARKSARTTLGNKIDARFDKMEANNASLFDKVETRIKESEGRIEDIDRRVFLLENIPEQKK